MSLSPQPDGPVVVVSPHLDDAVFSLGASLHAAAQAGRPVDVLTVLAGDPESVAPADDSNRRAGFATAGEAAWARREEDARACAVLGARPVWLALSDDRHQPVQDADGSARLGEALKGYATVLIPGYPLRHPDHLRVARWAHAVRPEDARIGLYVEQPYASWRALSRAGLRDLASEENPRVPDGDLEPAPPWSRTALHAGHWAAKLRAMRSYRSQLAVLRRAPRARIVLHEALHGGERFAWLGR